MKMKRKIAEKKLVVVVMAVVGHVIVFVVKRIRVLSKGLTKTFRSSIHK